MSLIEINIQGSKDGLGIRVIGPQTAESQGNVFIKSVTEGSLAASDGQLKAGDKLLKINDQDLIGITQKNAIEILKQNAQTNDMNFLVERSDEVFQEFESLILQQGEMGSASSSSMVGPSSQGDPGPALTGEPPIIEPTSEQQLLTITITIPKTSHLGIVPADSGLFGDATIIDFIQEGSDAERDGRLRPGDVILSVNKNSFEGLRHEKIQQLLTRMKISRRVKNYTVKFQRLGTEVDKQRLIESSEIEEKAILNSDVTVVHPTMVITSIEDSVNKGLPNMEVNVPSEGGFRGSSGRSSDKKHSKGKKQKGIQRKISLDPNCKVELAKLEMALNYLGYIPTEEQRIDLHSRLNIDKDGYVTYLEFVTEAKKLFGIQLDERQLTSGLYFLGAKEGYKEETEPVLEFDPEPDIQEPILVNMTEDRLREMEDLQEEVNNLKRELEATETRNEQILAKQTESDRTIRHLLTELQQQQCAKPALNAREDEDADKLMKKLSIVDCEYRKLQSKVRRYEVGLEKLLDFCQLAHECLSQAGGSTAFTYYPRGKGEPMRSGNEIMGNSRPPAPLAKHARFTNITIAKEAQETVAAVRKIISNENALPSGWDEAFTEDGLKYYINYDQQTTSWQHPLNKGPANTGKTDNYNSALSHVNAVNRITLDT